MFLSLDEGWETPASENILIEDLKFIKFNILFFDYKSYIYIYIYGFQPYSNIFNYLGCSSSEEFVILSSDTTSEKLLL